MMRKRRISAQTLKEFRQSLENEDMSRATVEKYTRDATKFAAGLEKGRVTADAAVKYKEKLIEAGYTVSSINSMLAGINKLLEFTGNGEYRAKNLRQQRQLYEAEERELSRKEYERLLKAAKDKPRLCMLLQTICATGIRISELSYFTVEAVKKGEIRVNCKGKDRRILLPEKLRKKLLCYARLYGIDEGYIFRTRSGRALDRSNVWAEMKALCTKAGVMASKVFPHNLRKLFARTFYSVEKDIAHLADILGHSSINTTRIYVMATGRECRKKIEKLDLLI